MKITCLELQKCTHFKLLYRHQGLSSLMQFEDFSISSFFSGYIYSDVFTIYFFSFSTCCKCSISNHGFEMKKGNSDLKIKSKRRYYICKYTACQLKCFSYLIYHGLLTSKYKLGPNVFEFIQAELNKHD